MDKKVENKARNQILLVLFLGVLMGALDIAIVGPALPAIRSAFSVSERALAWMFSIYVLFNLIGTPLMAKLSDLFGRRWIYILDISLFAAGSLLVAVAPTFTWVLVGRAIQGFGAGGVFPVASAVIGDTFPPEKRGGALGLIGAVFGLAFIIGPILGGVLMTYANWHWLFLINLPIAVIIIAMSLTILPATRPSHKVSFDWAGMLVVAAGLAALAFGINQIDTTRFFASLVSAQVWPFLLAALALFALLAQIEQRAESPILPTSLFNRRQLGLAYFLSAGAGFGEASLVYMPLLAVVSLGAFGVTERSASYLLMPVVLAMAFGSPTAGRMLDKFGSKAVILAGTGVMAVGMFLLGSYSASMTMFIVSGLLIGLGLSALLGAPIRYIMLNEAKASERSVAQGVVALFTSVGQLMGSSMVGAVAASRSGQSAAAGYSTAFLTIAMIGVILFATAFLLKSRSDELKTIKENEALAQPAVSGTTAV